MSSSLKIIETRFYAVCFMCLYAVMVYESFPGLARMLGLRPKSGLYPAPAVKRRRTDFTPRVPGYGTAAD
ncbi:MAG TPA: hypothetical protein PK176_11100 [Acidobacteriota bacterium]|nr:hypothetical protein [Acidobacteriota bacterium]HQM63850.1 hypothetical protein [Acidobacteriota bacterium]